MPIVNFYCTNCGSILEEIKSGLSCSTCMVDYPKYLDIVDLRFPRPIFTPKNLTRINEMIDQYKQLTFSDLLNIFLREAQLSENVLEQTNTYYQQQDIRSEKMTGMLIEKSENYFGSVSQGVAIDLGCGSGGGTEALSRRFEWVYGVDSDLAQLILAKKYLQERHVNNVTLICAFTQKLPFGENVFSFAQGINIIEHLEENLSDSFQEIKRCLKLGGVFVADSRNRFDVFMPEPHSGIRFLGFLPRKVTTRLVRKVTGNHYQNTQLISYRELRRAICTNFDNYKIALPDIRAYGKSDNVEKWISSLKSNACFTRLLLSVISAQIVVAKK